MQQICLCWLDGELGSGPTPEEVASLGLPVFPSDEGGERSTPAREAVKQAVELAAGKKAQGQYRNSDEGSPFILGEALPVVPGKLVLKIQRGEYVDMAELLKDNRREEAQGEQRRRRGRRGACYAYNEGKCFLPYCRFEHVCSVCGGQDHRKSTCRSRGHRVPERSGPAAPQP